MFGNLFDILLIMLGLNSISYVAYLFSVRQAVTTFGNLIEIKPSIDNQYD